MANEVTIELKDGNGNPFPIIAIDVGSSSSPVYICSSSPFDANGNPLFTGVNPGITAPIAKVAGAQFTRPNNATPYSAGELVANDTNPANVLPMSFPVARVLGGTVEIKRARMTKSGLTSSGAVFRLWLFKIAPATVTNGDGGAFSVSGSLNFVGSFTFDFTSGNAFTFTDGMKVIAVPDVGSQQVIDTQPTSNAIFGLLEINGSYTPNAQEVYTVALEVNQN